MASPHSSCCSGSSTSPSPPPPPTAPSPPASPTSSATPWPTTTPRQHPPPRPPPRPRWRGIPWRPCAGPHAFGFLFGFLFFFFWVGTQVSTFACPERLGKVLVRVDGAPGARVCRRAVPRASLFLNGNRCLLTAGAAPQNVRMPKHAELCVSSETDHTEKAPYWRDLRGAI